MIQDRIAKIEATLSSSPNIPYETRQELLALMADLKAETAAFATTHGAEAQSLAQMTDVAVEQATREERQPEQTAVVVGHDAQHDAKRHRPEYPPETDGLFCASRHLYCWKACGFLRTLAESTTSAR